MVLSVSVAFIEGVVFLTLLRDDGFQTPLDAILAGSVVLFFDGLVVVGEAVYLHHAAFAIVEFLVADVQFDTTTFDVILALMDAIFFFDFLDDEEFLVLFVSKHTLDRLLIGCLVYDLREVQRLAVGHT